VYESIRLDEHVLPVMRFLVLTTPICTDSLDGATHRTDVQYVLPPSECCGVRPTATR